MDVVARYVPSLRKRGRHFSGLCPFHSERTPSFVVSPEQQSWHCFGACGVGGDLFAFVMRAEGIDFPDALQELARLSGVSLTERRRSRDVSIATRSPLVALNQEALRFFLRGLRADRGALAREYLASRGISEEMVSRFELGYCPIGGDELLRHFATQGVRADQVVEAGLATVLPGSGATRDLLRGRLTFALRDEDGTLVGFAGRSLDGTPPKYLNTPQTELFDKGRILYGLDRVGKVVVGRGELVVVEGYMDVITAHQFGFGNVVASMGTALTTHQVSLLRRYARRFVLALDGDTAGQEATLRSLEGSWQVLSTRPAPSGIRARPADLQALRVVVLGQGKDPDELLRENRDAWHSLVESARPVVDYLFDVLASRTEVGTSQGKAELVQRLFPLITAVANPYDQDRYFQRLANLVDVSPSTMAAIVGRPRAGVNRPLVQAATESSIAAALKRTEGDPLEEHVLALMMRYPELLVRVGEISPEWLWRSESRAILSCIENAATIDDLDSVHPSEDLIAHWNSLRGRELPTSDYSQRAADFVACLRRLEERYLRRLKAREEELLSSQPRGIGASLPEYEIRNVNERLRQLFASGDGH